MVTGEPRGIDDAMTIPHSSLHMQPRLHAGMKAGTFALAAALLIGGAASAVHAATPVVESEEAFVHKMDPAQPHWAFVHGGWNGDGTRIFDGDTGKMKGMINTSKWSDMALDPTNSFYYVSETIWTKVIRGTRQDMVSIYDPVDLKLVAEVPIPSRILIGGRKNNFIISDDGRTGFIYNLSPASSVNVVDLAKRKFVQTVEIPGCASLMPNTGVGFSALCGDGTIATVALGSKTPVITHTAPFFSATNDPVFDNFTYDKAKAEVAFISYTGLIYQAKLGAAPVVAAPWSIQAAAGLRPGDTKPLDINWLPGGRSPMALHRPTGHLYVLMHMGEYWTQKEDGTEIWDVDLATKKVGKRFPLKVPAGNIEISQDAKPLIFINGDDGKTRVIDATTWEQKFEIERSGGGVIATIAAR